MVVSRSAGRDFRHCTLTTRVVKVAGHSLEEVPMKSTRWLSRVMALALLVPIGVHATTTADAIATIERNAKAAHSGAGMPRSGATSMSTR